MQIVMWLCSFGMLSFYIGMLVDLKQPVKDYDFLQWYSLIVLTIWFIDASRVLYLAWS